MPFFGLLVRRFAPWMLIVLLFSCSQRQAMADASSAALIVAVTDSSGALVREAEVVLRNVDTNQEQHSTTGKSGGTTFPFLMPGLYSLIVSKSGFSDVAISNVRLNVGDQRQFNLVLRVGSTQQTVDVDGSGLAINSTDGSVSTVIDRKFVANIPLNGRSFQDLISMTPGVVTASPQSSGTSPGSNGDFSINGQRTESNYYTVDGVAANVGAGPSASTGYGPAGVAPATSALGTTQSLLSVDDLQEFRVESSSYSAEFGRSPGGQLSFATRSGTNDYHGSGYDYFRNGWFDANDWFNDRTGQSKQQLHQNDFGGTLGGPIWIPNLYHGTDRTFFFGSYEGLRASEPVAATVQYVPDLYLRQQAPAALRPLLNAFPLPSLNGVDYGTQQSPSLAQFFQGYSIPGRIDSTSIRIDQTFTPALSVFFRFADTPSSVSSRSYSVLTSQKMNAQTYTFGTTYIVSSSATNQFRLGHSSSFSGSSSVLDSFGGAIPSDLGKGMGSTTGITGQSIDAEFELSITGIGFAYLNTPTVGANQHQWNLTDTFEIVHGKQHWKIGADYRQVYSLITPAPISMFGLYLSANSVLNNLADSGSYSKSLSPSPVLNQFALFVQNDWRINSRVSLSGGLRWELAPPPHNAGSPQPYTLIGDLNDPQNLGLAPAGTPLWHTAWYNFAPRLGIAWQAHTASNWVTVLRSGGGVFFDTSNQIGVPPFVASGFTTTASYSSVPLPFTQAQQNISVSLAPPYNNIWFYPSHLQLPYTLEWNASIEQQLGRGNAANISYIGSDGRRLTAGQQLSLASFNPLLRTILYVRGITSDYNALQAKFQRNVSKGLNALVAYTWSHSFDYGSNFSALPLTRGNSDFDVRDSFQGGLTWELPQAKVSEPVSAVVNGWAFDGRLIARTGFPITLQGNSAIDPLSGSRYFTNVNRVPNQPVYLFGTQYPGGRSLNPAAFAFPTGTNPGNAPRNFVRGFGESQVNFAVRREVLLSERARFEFRAEAFNIFNHPNFGYVDPLLTDSKTTFGQATQMLNQSLGTVASQYQQGGPRSMQFSLRLAF
jgi:hypothetical protein